MAKARVLIPTVEEARRRGVSSLVPDLAVYHCTNRICHRQMLFGAEEKEEFRKMMRMHERFSGCRVLAFCIMGNHVHLLLEVPPMPAAGTGGEVVDRVNGEGGVDLRLSGEELVWRLGGLYSRKVVAAVGEEIAVARQKIAGDWNGFEELTEAGKVESQANGERALIEIFERYTRRMHDLSKFMKGLLHRFSCWFNKRHDLSGTLWEGRFNSVIVEGGLACRTMAAYIDLNPVRAGICELPEDYRWSSYGEAIGGGRGANKARAGLVRALHGHEGREGTARGWSQGGVSKRYRAILVEGGIERVDQRSDGTKKVTRQGRSRAKAEAELARLKEAGARDVAIAKVVRCRIRYFTDGAVIGSRKFVNAVFHLDRGKFGSKRKDGARKPRGTLKELEGEIWAMRDLQPDEVPE